MASMKIRLAEFLTFENARLGFKNDSFLPKRIGTLKKPGTSEFVAKGRNCNAFKLQEKIERASI